MTDPDLISRFRTDLMQRIAAQERVPQGHPLPISPWLAMSLLQKAVRRGRADLALNAAATLLRDAPDRLWRRLGGIAFEDVGLGSLPTVGLTVAALTGKQFRTAIGGDWAVASVVVKALADARRAGRPMTFTWRWKRCPPLPTPAAPLPPKPIPACG